MSFCSAELSGRLGNQCFQIAACVTTALKFKVPYLIPQRVVTNDEMYFPHLPVFDPAIHRVRYVHNDSDLKYKPIHFYDRMMLKGYFQSWNHSNGYLDEVINILGFKYELNKGVVGIHVRRGDFVVLADKHPFKPDYYFIAIKYFASIGYKKFKVFSDDIAWCKQFFGGLNYEFTYSEGLTAIQDMEQLSWCEHQIIAASTFSIWSAMLNKNPHKIVTRPNFFLGGRDAKLYRYVYMSDWKIINA